MALTKAERYVVLQLLNAATKGGSQAELAVLRADCLGVLGLTETDAAELTTADARAAHTEGDVHVPANAEAEADAAEAAEGGETADTDG